MKTQKIWAIIVGITSATVGVLRLFSIVTIPFSDAIVHIVTGLALLTSVMIKRGSYAGKANILTGIFYVGFGIGGNFNWPHIILGIVSFIVGMLEYV